MAREFSDIMDSMEKNDVRILGDCHWIFDCHADSRLYISISEFSELLGIPWYRSRFVSNDCLITIPFISHLDLPVNAFILLSF